MEFAIHPYLSIQNTDFGSPLYLTNSVFRFSACKMEKSLWEQYNIFLKDKFGMGTEFIGETKDNKTKTSPDLSSKAVEKPVDEEKQASEPLVMIPSLEQRGQEVKWQEN